MNAVTRPLRFGVTDGSQIELSTFRLVVAGYTGRDADAVEAHIAELEAIGVPRPDSVPAFYELAPDLVTTSADVQMSGHDTSGEVEPVLIRSSGRLFLGVGSDHTDRLVERTSVPASKAACVKPVSSTVLPLPDDLDWDAVRLRSRVDDMAYQDGPMSGLRPTTEVLGLWESADADDQDLVLFGGTVPLIAGEFVSGHQWWVSLTLADGASIEHFYRAHAS